MERLTAEDRLMLWPDELWPQEIGLLALLDGTRLLDADGRFRITAARRAVEARLHLVPRFRQVLLQPHRGLGGPLGCQGGAASGPIDLLRDQSTCRHGTRAGRYNRRRW
jgi:hypothetical protein